MKLETTFSNNKSSVVVFLIRLLIMLVVGFCLTASALGVYFLKTFLPMYIKERDIKKFSLEPITATVMSVDREVEKNSETGYMKLSYEYNGINYVSDLEYYVEGKFHYSTSERNDRRGKRGDNGSSSDNWEELQAMVGEEYEVFLDPDEPDKVYTPITDDSLMVIKVLAIIGFVLIAIVVAVIVFAIILVKKIIKNRITKLETTDTIMS